MIVRQQAKEYMSGHKLKNKYLNDFNLKKFACTFMKFSQNIFGIYMHLLHIKFSKFSFTENQ